MLQKLSMADSGPPNAKSGTTPALVTCGATGKSLRPASAMLQKLSMADSGPAAGGACCRAVCSGAAVL
eukprot:CAMPEP_0115500786 /NCGR_PEP_ID=MMETSP0271-20121206/68053_1 /TAXON_ID=71861 /ORGANISM="Scrippsiella trochoidea, Strain CCMP3099" /LENGTH=67 /DNA_ID=CAMNT_0002929683 /DNA_START=496 /DNA_END=699 /DNA_ORIENTATION=-